jgi:DNA-binding transcriptional ArsR family regulator
MQDYLFAKLPIALIKSGFLAELKPSSVVVYNVLLSHADFNTGRCFPSISTIRSLSGLSEPTVINAIKELEDWGLVDVLRRQGSHNVYQLKYWWGDETTTQKNLRGGLKNFKGTPKISSTLTTTNDENQLKRANVVEKNRPRSDNSPSNKDSKRFVYQLRIANLQQQQSWLKTVQNLFSKLFYKELPAELIEEKLCCGTFPSRKRFVTQ